MQPRVDGICRFLHVLRVRPQQAIIARTGLHTGGEVAQLYVGYEGTQVDRPVKAFDGGLHHRATNGRLR